MNKNDVVNDEAMSYPPFWRAGGANPSFLERWPVRVSQGMAVPQPDRSPINVKAHIENPQDAPRGEFGYPPIPFRIPRLASSDIEAWGSMASQHQPYTQGGYYSVDGQGLGGSERLPERQVHLTRFVFHSNIPALSDDRRYRANQMSGSFKPNANRMNIPAVYVPTAPITR